MMDMFTECLIKRRKHFREYIVIFPLITLGFAGTIANFAFLAGTMISGVGLAAVVMMWWGIYIVISKQNLEFEYTVTNGDIDIDVIMSQRSRKRLASFSVKDLHMMAPIEQLDDETFENVIDASAHDSRYDVYFILATIKGVKTKILVNPSKKMLDILKTFRPEKIVIGEE